MYIFKTISPVYLSGSEDEIDPRFPPGEVMFFGKEITGKEFLSMLMTSIEKDTMSYLPVR